MTPPINSVSDERLAEMLIRLKGEGFLTTQLVDEMRSILTELAARRAANTPVDGCETCGGSGKINQMEGGGWPGQAMHEVPCPDCSASPALPSAKGHWSDDKTYEEAPALPSQVVGVSNADVQTLVELWRDMDKSHKVPEVFLNRLSDAIDGINTHPAPSASREVTGRPDEMLVAALKGLVLLKDLFDASDRNQADAYYILAKQDGAWGNARSALLAALPEREG